MGWILRSGSRGILASSDKGESFLIEGAFFYPIPAPKANCRGVFYINENNTLEDYLRLARKTDAPKG
jgi:hypothetical protein